MESLLKLRVNLNEIDEDSESALSVAACGGHESVARLLLEGGANKNLARDGGWTALMVASHSGRIEVVRLLLASGADTDLRMNQGWTALMLTPDAAILTFCNCVTTNTFTCTMATTAVVAVANSQTFQFRQAQFLNFSVLASIMFLF